MSDTMQAEIDAAIERQRRVMGGEAVAYVYSDLYEKNDGPSPSDDRDTIMRFVLSHPYGTLKPLEWKDASTSELFTNQERRCNSISPMSMRRYSVTLLKDGSAQFFISGMGTWLLCDSIEHGKQLCWEHYQQQVRSLFVQNGGA